MKKLIYVVDDEPLQLHYLQAALQKINYIVEAFSDPVEMLGALKLRVPDAAVVDLVMPELSGVDLIRQIRTSFPYLPLVAVTAYPEIESAMEAVHAGANDYLKKPFQAGELQLVVERLLEAASLRDNLRQIVDKHAEEYSFSSFIGTSSAIETVRVELRRLADITNANILIHGPHGTGKSYAARIIHYSHPDVNKRLIEINCAKHSREKLEQELFGWDERQPDGSIIRHPSLCEVAGGGTILLDYINQADMDIQRMLHEYLVRVGADNTHSEERVACRIIAATTIDPESEEGRSAFYPPLFETLTLISLRIPSLVERGGDVVALAEHFISMSESSSAVKIAGLSDDAKKALLGYDWPGNIRELRSVIDRAIAIATTPEIQETDLHLGATYQDGEDGSSVTQTLASLRELEIDQIKRVLAYTKGDVTQAAGILGISRKSLWERRKRYAIS